LDQCPSAQSRLWHQRRADCLERLGRPAEAAQARLAAGKFPPNNGLALLLDGVDRLQRLDLPGAVSSFDDLLVAEPNHFLARLFQAACFVRQKRPAEAKVGLTACLGQRPHFVWAYLLRAQAYVQLEEHAAALRDFQSGLDRKASATARVALLTQRGRLYLQQHRWAQARADFEQALALVPDAAEAIDGLNRAQEKGS
jgi:tetratricopeptide (TPR) repeat protein